jgi:hypothetical protein
MGTTCRGTHVVVRDQRLWERQRKDGGQSKTQRTLYQACVRVKPASMAIFFTFSGSRPKWKLLLTVGSAPVQERRVCANVHALECVHHQAAVEG